MSENILELQIRNLFSSFSKNATEILTTIQNGGANYQLADFYKYLQGYFDDLSKFRDILQNTASIASEAPFGSIKIFYDLLPHINATSEKQPNLNTLNTFIAFIRQPQPQIDWSNQHSRYGIALYVEVLAAIFCLEIVENADFSSPRKQQDAKQIYTFIKTIISTNITDPQYNKFRTISASIFANVLFYLSKVDPSIYNQALDYLKNNSSFKDYTDDKPSIYFNLYSKIYFRDVHDLDKNIRKQISQLSKSANKAIKQNYDLHCAIYKFLTNFVGNLCMSDDSFRNPKGLINDVYPQAKSMLSTNYSGPAFECFAILITFAVKAHDLSKHLQDFTKYAKSPDHSFRLLNSYIIFLIGINYKAIYHNGEQYTPDFHIIKDLHIVNEMFDSVYDNSSVFAPHQDLMTEFIVQIAAADIQSFILTKLPEKIFRHKSLFLQDHGQAIFGAARVLIHSAYHFPIDEKKRLHLINYFQEKALTLASNYDPTAVDNWTKTVSKLRVFLIRSFVESVTLHHNNINELYYYNQSESIPLTYTRPTAKTVVTAVINRWKKMFSSDLASLPLFQDEDHQLKTFNPDIVNHLILPSAICIVPIAKPSLLCIEDLAMNLYSESADVSAASIRSLQAIIHLSENNDIVEEIMDYVDHFINKRTISSNEVLFRTIYTIELILDSICYKKFSISEKHRLMFNKAACIGLCSANYDIRLHGYNIGKYISRNSNKPSVCDIFDNYSEDISYITKIDVLSSISYKNYSTSDTSSFNDYDLMQSKFLFLYQFEIAAFASKLREKLDKDDLSAIRKTIIDFIKNTFSTNPSSQKKYIDGLYIANLIIFLFNSCTKSEYKSLAKLADLFIEIMNDDQVNQKNRQSPYFALLAEIDAEICLTMVSSYSKLDEHFLLPLLFSLRRRIDNKEVRLTNELTLLILSFLERTFDLFQSNSFSHTKLTFTAPKPNNCILEEQLHSFLEFSKTMFGFLRYNNQRDPPSPFNRVSVFSKATKPNNKESLYLKDSIDLKDSNDSNENNDSNEPAFKVNLDLDSWQIFLLNIGGCDNHLGKSAQNTLTSLMRVFPVSEKIYSQFLHNLQLFDMNAKVINSLLIQSILYMQYSYKYMLCDFIINESHIKMSYFKALASLFREASSVDQVIKDVEKSMRNEPTLQDKSFYDIIYKHAGSLLALSFYYILLSDGLERGAGFRVLQSISIGLAISRNNISPKLCHRIEELRPHIVNSQHSNTALESCASLSKVLASEFSFLSEQFVFSIFTVISKEESLSLIVLPWIKSINLSSVNNHQKVITPTESYFTMFTADTFITCLLSLPSSKNVLRIIAKVIEEQEKDSLDIFEFIFIKIFTSKLHKKSNAKRYATIIVYLYTLYPEKVLKMLMNILSFDYWQYNRVQFNKMDALFDISKFLSQLAGMSTASSTDKVPTDGDSHNSDKKKPTSSSKQEESMVDFYQNSNGSILMNTPINSHSNPNYGSNQSFTKNVQEDDDGDEEDDDIYKTTVTFVLSIMLYCVNEKKEPFESFLPDLVLFSYVNINEYPSMCLPILSALLPFDGSDDEELHNFILQLDLPVRERLSVQSLAWGLCCGDLDIALNGLAFFRFVGLEVTDDIVDAVLKSLFVVSSVLYERTHKIQVPAEKQWLYQVLDMKKEPDYRLTMCYVENLINILSMAEPRKDVFYTVTSILNLSGDDTSSVLNASIIYITKMLSSPDFAHKMSKEEFPNDFKGLIPMIASCCFDQNTTNYFFDFFRVIQNSKSDLKQLGYNAKETKYLYEIIETIMNVIDSEKSQTVLTENSLSKYPVRDLNIILMLLTQFLFKMKGNHQPLIYDLCVQILATNVDDEYVEMLARPIKADKNFSNFHSITELLKAINKHGVEIAQQPFLGSKLSFPKLSFKIDYAKSMGEEKNPSKDNTINETFPYLMPSDTGFLNCPIMSTIKTSVERVLAQPFTDWSDLMFKCCSIELEEKVIDDKKQLMFKYVNRETFKKWTHEIALYVDDDDDKVVLYNIEPPQLPKPKEVMDEQEKIDTMEINTIDTVTTDLFLPTSDLIESIGHDDVFKGLNLPTVVNAQIGLY